MRWPAERLGDPAAAGLINEPSGRNDHPKAQCALCPAHVLAPDSVPIVAVRLHRSVQFSKDSLAYFQETAYDGDHENLRKRMR